MYKLSHKHLPLRQTDIQVTGFDWRRLNTASMLHKNWQMISLENLLPDSEQLLTNLKNLGKACPTLHRFGFAHINKMALLGGTGIIKTMDVRFPGAAHTCLLKHFLDPVVDTDSLNREALMSLQGRYERMIKENKARYEKGLPCNPPSHYNLSHFQPYHTDFSGVKYGFDLEFGE